MDTINKRVHYFNMKGSSQTEMNVGVVKWFKNSFGFITPKDGSDDIFVHFSDIVSDGFKTLKEGDQVEYEVGQGQKGPQAKNVSVIYT